MPKTAKELERILLRHGWIATDQKGSHRHYKHPYLPGKITISFHGNRTVKIGVEKSILQKAGIKEDIK